MKDLFVPKAQSIQLKELGFDEPCLGRHYYKESYPMLNPQSEETELVFEFGQYIKQTDVTILAPTFSQAFRFFREKYNLYTNIDYDWNDEVFRVKIMKQNEDKSCNIIFLKEGEYIKDYDCFEEAELACLDKLIEILKNKQ